MVRKCKKPRPQPHASPCFFSAGLERCLFGELALIAHQSSPAGTQDAPPAVALSLWTVHAGCEH
jgi:hypothetical protein